MPLTPYQISCKSTKRFRSYYRGTHTQTDRRDLISLLSFLKSKLKINVRVNTDHFLGTRMTMSNVTTAALAILI
jgi:hypothetical protein